MGLPVRVQKPKGFRHHHESCRRQGCGLPAINGYCTKEHAPYGELADAPDDYLTYPTDLPEPPPSKKRIHKSSCMHVQNCPYTCRSQRLRIPRASMAFDDRCLCPCHDVPQHDDFDEGYE